MATRNKISLYFLFFLSLIWGVSTLVSTQTHGMQPEVSIKSKKTSKKGPEISPNGSSTEIIEQKFVDKTEKEIEEDILKQLNKQYDIEPYNRTNGTPGQGEANKVINQLRRDRYAHIKAATEDMYKTSLVVAESYLWEEKFPNSEQVKLWNDLGSILHRETFRNYDIEVHYINLDDVIFKDVEPYDFKIENTYNFKYQDNKRIISAVIFKPKSPNNKVPLGIFNHGGSPGNWFRPYQRNPILSAFAGLKYGIIFPNYRGGSAENHEEDMSAVVNYVNQLDYIDSNKIVLAGISAGTTLNAKILDKPIAKNLAGVFLHTGLYKSPDLFDAILGIPENLPLFLASGKNDSLTDVNSTLKYIRALQDISKNFSFYIVDHGGHQLIEARDDAVPLELSPENLVKIRDIEDHYNSDEMMDYISHLIEFLDRIAYGEIPTPFQKLPTPTTEPIPSEKPAMLHIGEEIVRKAQVGQEIKETPKLPFKKTPEYPARKEGRAPLEWLGQEETQALKFGPKILQKGNELVNAAYTPSQAQLKILLGDDYNDDLRETIVNFLKKYDSEKEIIKQAYERRWPLNQVEIEKWAKRINEQSFQDEYLVNKIEQIFTKELQYKGSYVLYHGASSRAGFVYDVYSVLRNLLRIQGKAITNKEEYAQIVDRLRLLDDAFEKIMTVDDLIAQTRPLEKKDPVTVFNYLGDYQKVGISAQWFLFGSYKYWFNSTFFRYFLEGTSAKDVPIHTILREFFMALGLTNEEDLQRAVGDYTKIYNAYIDPSDGRLLQIFVSPSIIDEVAYVSETVGYPLDLNIPGVNGDTHAPSKIILEALKTPQSFEEILKNNRDNFKQQGFTDRIGFFNDVNNMVYINALEARFFMKPEYMDDPSKIQIINYHLHEPKTGYVKALQEGAARSLSVWLNAQPKLGPAMTHHKPPLVKLQEYVQQGVGPTIGQGPPRRKSFTLYDLLSAGKWNEAENWVKAHPKDIEAKMDAHGHPLLYQLLHDKKFQAAEKLVALSKQQNKTPPLVNGKDAKGYPIIYDLLVEGNLEAAQFLIQHNANLRLTANNNALIIDLLLNDKFNEAKFLTNTKVYLTDKYTADGGIIKLIQADNWEGAKEWAIQLVGSVPVSEDQLTKSQGSLRNIVLGGLTAENVSMAEELIQKGASVNQKNKGVSLLEEVLEQYDLETAQWLIAKGASFPRSKQIAHLTSALSISLVSDGSWVDGSWPQRDQAKAQWIYARGVNVNDLEYKDEPIIFDLVDTQKWDKLKWLVDHGLNLNALNSNVSTDQKKAQPLFHWIWNKYDNAVDITGRMERLIGLGIDMNGRKIDGTSLIYIFLGVKSEWWTLAKEVGDFLVGKGLDVNIRNKSGNPVLYPYLELQSSTFDHVQWLIEKGADVNAATNNGQSIFNRLISDGKINQAGYLLKYIKQGDQIEKNDLNLNQLLFLEIQKACVSQKWDTVELLVKSGANINAPNSEGTPPLNWIVLNKNLSNDQIKQSVEKFVSLGVNVNGRSRQKDHVDNSPLIDMLDYRNDNPELREAIGKFLLNQKANIEQRNGDGATPLYMFLSVRQDRFGAFKDRAQWLIDNGATVNGKTLAGRFYIEQLALDDKTNAANFLLETNKIEGSPLMHQKVRDMILKHAIKTEQWEKLNQLKWRPKESTSKDIIPMDFPTDILKWALDTAIESKWESNKTIDIFNRLIQLGVDINENDFFLYLLGTEKIDANLKNELVSLLLSKGLILPLSTIYSNNEIIWLNKQKLNDNQKARHQEIIKMKIKILAENKQFGELSKIQNLAPENWQYSILIDMFSKGKMDEVQALLVEQFPNDSVNQKKEKERLFLTVLAQGKTDLIKKIIVQEEVSLNIPDTLKQKIQNDQKDAAKAEANALLTDRVDTNTKLLNLLTSKNKDWKQRAELIIKNNPYRDTFVGELTGVYKRLLYRILESDNYEQAQWLIDNGADLDLTQVETQDVLNLKEKRPILLSILFWDPKYIEDSLKSAEILIRNGANVNASYEINGVSNPILHKFLNWADYEDKIKYLISKGANVNISIGGEKLPILLERLIHWNPTYRERYGNILIENGANVNARTGNGQLILTHLLMAKIFDDNNENDIKKKTDAAKFLLKYGAKLDPGDLDLETTSGETIREFIQNTGDPELRELLK